MQRTKVIHIRVTPELWERLKELATRDQRTLSSWGAKALEELTTKGAKP